MRPLAAAFALTLAATGAEACIEGMKCLKPSKSTYQAPHKIGDILPRGSFNVLLNSTYHGLPVSDGSFWYVQTGRHIYKVTPNTYEVLDDVTLDARRINR